MIPNYRKVIAVLVLTGLSFTLLPAQNPARPVIKKMMTSMENLNTLFARVKRAERVGSGIVNGEMVMKVQEKPRKLYLFNVAPSKGTEILFVKGWNKDKAYVSPKSFPYVNVSLHPHNGQLLKQQHHTLYDAGLSYTRFVISSVLNKYADEFDEHVSYRGKITWKGVSCHAIEINYENYAIEEYTVQGKENCFDVGNKLVVPAYKIIDLNPNVKGFFDLKDGMTIKVPNVYGKRVILYVDTNNHLPILQMIYDEKGLFEKYEYSEIKYNPVFQDAEFTTDFEGYGFKL